MLASIPSPANESQEQRQAELLAIQSRLDSLRGQAIEADKLPPTERSVVLAALEIQFRMIQERIVELKQPTTA